MVFSGSRGVGKNLESATDPISFAALTLSYPGKKGLKVGANSEFQERVVNFVKRSAATEKFSSLEIHKALLSFGQEKILEDRAVLGVLAEIVAHHIQEQRFREACMVLSLFPMELGESYRLSSDSMELLESASDAIEWFFLEELQVYTDPHVTQLGRILCRPAFVGDEDIIQRFVDIADDTLEVGNPGSLRIGAEILEILPGRIRAKIFRETEIQKKAKALLEETLTSSRLAKKTVYSNPGMALAGGLEGFASKVVTQMGRRDDSKALVRVFELGDHYHSQVKQLEVRLSPGESFRVDGHAPKVINPTSWLRDLGKAKDLLDSGVDFEANLLLKDLSLLMDNVALPPFDASLFRGTAELLRSKATDDPKERVTLLKELLSFTMSSAGYLSPLLPEALDQLELALKINGDEDQIYIVSMIRDFFYPRGYNKRANRDADPIGNKGPFERKDVAKFIGTNTPLFVPGPDDYLWFNRFGL